MKFLVLIWPAFLMFSITSSDPITDTNSTSELWYTFINSTNLAKPGCNSTCGDLIVPYPFGIGDNSECYINEEFRIYCNTSLNPPKATIFEREYNSIKLISDSIIRLSNQLASVCYSPNGTIYDYDYIVGITNYMGGPYSLSKVNKFTVIGCDSSGSLTKWRKTTFNSRTTFNSTQIAQRTAYESLKSTGCMVYCSYPEEVVAGECTGNGCCQSSIPNGITDYAIRIRNSSIIENVSKSRTWALPCSYAFVGEDNYNVFKFKGLEDLNDTNLKTRIEDTVPIVVEWAIGNLSCSQAKATDGFACQLNSKCVSSTRKNGGYHCECKEGYEGNPYLPPGCQDINECAGPKKYPCYGVCLNTPGSYNCTCRHGYSGNAKIKDGCLRSSKNLKFTTIIFILGMAIGFLTILLTGSMLYFMAKKRKIAKLREKFYEQNGGTLLEEKLKTTGGMGVGFMKVFRFEELKEATDNYSEDRIVGKGGNGIVYKGTLPDKCVVAIKKSQRLDQGQREQFINEMVILTQIKHQNVVQLLGCCLETDVPLLVYEFVPNDTLHQHIHNRKSGMGILSWVNRLRIAHESADALAYLHTNVSMTIIHRDVKSTNILLDENYTAKIADFGASRLVPLGHDQVTTLVQGTFGYLDPEYFHTGQLTDKSDVYSFGVVLAELITGQRPLNMERCLEDRNLATYFVKAKKEDRLHEILDQKMVEEATDEQVKATCDLVYRCLNLVGGNRPSMKEVTMELESLRKRDKHPGIHQESYSETNSLIGEHEEPDLCIVPPGEYGSSSIGTEEIMLQVQSPR